MTLEIFRLIGYSNNAVFIVDKDLPGCPSITNAAEDIVRQLWQRWGGRRYFYRDTLGRWDELVHHQDSFVRFQPISYEDHRRYQEWLVEKEQV